MNPWIQKSSAVLLAAGFITLPLATRANEPVQKVQKITFIEDDAQKNMASKIYQLKYTKAADIAPFVRAAAFRYCVESSVSALNDKANNRQLLIVSTGINMIGYIDKIVATLDRNAKFTSDSNIVGDGIAYGTYSPSFRAADNMLEIMLKGGVASSEQDGAAIRFDEKSNMFYFKDTPATVADIKDKLSWLDKAIPQARIELTVYEVRDSDLKDIGIDYLAWKNGPGLNIFDAGYKALSVRAAEQVVELLAERGIELAGTATYGFGGFYTAPAFDMSFIRLLQQNGKAIVSSSAILTVSNVPAKKFSVKFAPEYQNIQKNDKHATSVTVGGDASLAAEISNTTITGGAKGVVIFNYAIDSKNVVERNNMGAELTESDSYKAHTSLEYNKEKILAVWNRTSTVEQTIGIPFLCELPILKYIFGTTTENAEVTRCIVTARAVPVVYNENMAPGTTAEFDSICKK